MFTINRSCVVAIPSELHAYQKRSTCCEHSLSPKCHSPTPFTFACTSISFRFVHFPDAGCVHCIYSSFSLHTEHPGGNLVLEEQAGGYATEPFEDVGHSEDAREMMATYYIGDISPSDKENPLKFTSPFTSKNPKGANSIYQQCPTLRIGHNITTTINTSIPFSFDFVDFYRDLLSICLVGYLWCSPFLVP
ncbi:unnamed protein product [Dicrocoelium dendriticum]|nr:unnamed protein product [Dicrocoelium dendriticum]